MADVLFKRGKKENLPQIGQDRDTIYFTEDTGEIYKSNGIGLPLMKYGGGNEETIVFVTNGYIKNGLQESSIVLPFNCKVELFTASYLTRDAEMLRTNIYKSTNYQDWTEVFEIPIEMIDGEHYKELTPSATLILNKGDILRLHVNTITNGNKNASANLKVTRL